MEYLIPLRVWRTMEISGNFHRPLWKFPFLRSQVSGLRIHRIHAAHLSYTWYFRKRVYPSVSLRMLFMYFRACTFKPMDREDSRPVATSRDQSQKVHATTAFTPTLDGRTYAPAVGGRPAVRPVKTTISNTFSQNTTLRVSSVKCEKVTFFVFY